MASSLALKRLVSSNLLRSSLRPAASSRFLNTYVSSSEYVADDQSTDVDRPLFSRKDFSPFSARRLSQILNMIDSPISAGTRLGWDPKETGNALYLQMVASGLGKDDVKVAVEQNTQTIKSQGQKESEDDHYPSKTKTFLRPLSPHLPVYKPQMNSTTSIFNRISGIYLSAAFLSFHLLYLKTGSICFTYDNFYQFFFYSSKLIPITLEIGALALSYHVYQGVRHLWADFTGNVMKVK